MTEEEFRDKVRLIGRLGAAFHKYGTNAERLEACLEHVTKSLGLRGNFFSTPTYLTISLDSGDEQITRHIRALPPDVNLEKLQDLDTIAVQVLNHTLTYEQAIEKLDELETRANTYNSATTIVAFGLTSLSLSVLFGGSILDSFVSLGVGSVVGILAVLKNSFDKISQAFEFLASYLVTFLSCLIFHYIIHFDFQNVIISSLIVIIPGIGVTIAMNELASHNLVSGTARLMGSLIGLMKISFGIYLAVQTNLIFFATIKAPMAIALPVIYIVPAMLITSVTFTVIFSAKRSDYVWVLLSGIITYGSLRLCNIFLSPVLSVFIASFTIGIFSNLFAKIRNRPSLITLLPGIIFLVPGSVGIKGLNLLFENNMLEGIDSSIQMFILSITIVTGLFIANIFLSPRKGL